MVDFNKENERDINWKDELRSEIVNAFIGQGGQMVYHKIENYYNNFLVQTSLYKYYKDDKQNLNNVRLNKIWCSVACNFNDIFDFNVPIDKNSIVASLYMQAHNKKLSEGTLYHQYVSERMRDNVDKIKSAFECQTNKIGVSCFSESYQSLLMWAHYANNHCGFCVEYDISKIVEKYCIGLIPVKYSDERVILKSIDMKNIDQEINKFFIECASLKSKEWNYEKEWRILLPDQFFKKGDWYEKKGGLLDIFNPTSIILGCKMNSQFEKEVRDYCETSKINLYKMEKDPFLYRLNKKAVLEFKIED